MRKAKAPDRLELDLEISFAQFGKFVFKENQPKSTEQKSTSKPSPLYVFPKSTAAIAEL